jgi:hypothetical protein
MPRSLLLFALTGVVYLLQLIPLTGIFLMMMAASLWPTITINLGFIGLGYEALARPGVSRLWLVAPVVWFGGYAVAATMNHHDFDVLKEALAAQNVGKTMPFAPEHDALVFEPKGGLAVASNVVRSYDVPVAYQTNPNLMTATHLASRIGDAEICRRIREDPLFNDSGIYSSGFHENHTFIRGLCVYYAPEDPALPPVTVSISGKETHPGPWLPYEVDHLRIEDATGRSIDLVVGYSAPLQWWPAPMFGCALNDAAASWDCFAGFGREGRQGLGSTDPAVPGGLLTVVAGALGLKRSAASERRAEIDAAENPLLETVVERQLDVALANLDRVIADPASGVTRPDVAGLGERPDLLAPRADAMIATLARALDGGAKTRGEGLVLESMLAALDDETFRRVGDSILAVFAARPDLDPDAVERTLPTRLGDLGPAALPVLERLAFAPRRPREGPFFGICRVGAPAAYLAERVAEAMPKTSRSDAAHTAAYLALLRMGRPDLADTDPEADSRFMAKRYANMRQTVTPSSPASVCVPYRYWPELDG